MASSKEYLTFILDQLSGLDGITCRAMMGVPAALSLMPDAPRELPYEGAKEMLLVENVDDADFLKSLFRAMYGELQPPRAKSRKR